MWRQINSKVFWLAIFVLIAGSFWAGNNFYQSRFLNNYLYKQGVQMSPQYPFRILESDKNNISAEYENKFIKIKKINNLSSELKEKYKKEQEALLLGLFEPQLPPYPEFLTKETGCQDKFKPIKNEYPDKTYYLLYAGSRRGYGVCADDLIVYRASWGFLSCAQNLFKFEIFTPADEEQALQELSESFVCL